MRNPEALISASVCRAELPDLVLKTMMPVKINSRKKEMMDILRD
jgi:hypothetical protein